MNKVIYVILPAMFLSGCSGCSRSGRMAQNHNNTMAPQNTTGSKNEVAAANTIKMQKVNGVYQIPVEIDHVPMTFIFDTGAGIISISEVEALFLYKRGELSQDDIIGKANFSDANGNISEGTIINLRTVKIGSRVLHDVKASVVHNLGAPLLFGQTALEQFGKISIDYKKEEITFE